jgi:hypothetical protein
MAEPFNRCPGAISPPEGAAFSVPSAAPFDVPGTMARRSQGFRECCYAWCSKPPPSPVEIAKPKAQAAPDPPRALR